jgi:hypothetical protein
MEKSENGWKKTLIVIGYGWVTWVSVTMISAMIFMGRGGRFTELQGHELERQINALKTRLIITELKLEHHEQKHKP